MMQKLKKAMCIQNQSEKTIENIPKRCSSQITCNSTAKSKKTASSFSENNHKIHKISCNKWVILREINISFIISILVRTLKCHTHGFSLITLQIKGVISDQYKRRPSRVGRKWPTNGFGRKWESILSKYWNSSFLRYIYPDS